MLFVWLCFCICSGVCFYVRRCVYAWVCMWKFVAFVQCLCVCLCMCLYTWCVCVGCGVNVIFLCGMALLCLCFVCLFEVRLCG